MYLCQPATATDVPNPASALAAESFALRGQHTRHRSRRLPGPAIGLALALACLSASRPAAAPLPTPERLLPDDTLLAVSIPDTGRALQHWRSSPPGGVWEDPAMEAFRAGLGGGTNDATAATGPSQERPAWSGGQMTLGLLRNGWAPGSSNSPALVLFLDGGPHAPQLRQFLARLRATLVTNGITVGSRTLGNLEFMEAHLSAFDVLRMSLLPGTPPAPTATPGTHGRFFATQSDNWLLAGSDAGALELMLARIQGAPTNGLADHPRFRPVGVSAVVTADAFAWADLVPAIEVLQAHLGTLDAQPSASTETPMPKRTRLLEVSGLTAVRHLSAACSLGEAGAQLDVSLGMPSAERAGLFRALELAPLDASPSPAIPATASSTRRVRIDLRRCWLVLEQMLTEAFPQTPNVLRFLLQTSAGTGSEKIDLREEILSSLGDDLEFHSEPGTTTNTATPATAFRIASTNATRLLEIVRSLSGLLPPPMNEATTLTLDGRRVLRLPAAPDGTNPVAPTLLAAGPRGLVGSSDAVLLNRLLQTNPATATALVTTPALAAAARAAGGMTHGYFSFADWRTTLGSTWEKWRQGHGLPDWLADLAPAGHQAWTQTQDTRGLPAFDAIRNHLGPAASSLRVDADGFHYRLHLGPPPAPEPARSPEAPAVPAPAPTNPPPPTTGS